MSGNDWREGANKRRDARHTKSPDNLATSVAGAAGVSKPSKKDTKKWCRGKVGVEHQPECRNYVDAKAMPKERQPGVGYLSTFYKNWKVLVCKVCGKELANYWGRKKNKPDWVK